jgi:hypothetical protein
VIRYNITPFINYRFGASSFGTEVKQAQNVRAREDRGDRVEGIERDKEIIRK